MGFRKDKQGIALVIVLGFLAILTLMAVGFAISMRTEHLVSRSYLASVSARQLAATALARALNDIEDSISTNSYPSFATTDHLYTNLLYTTGTNTTDFSAVSALTNYVPGALHDELSLAAAAQGGGWEAVTNAQGETVGRIGYAVANCSGFLDAGRLMQTNRSNGLTTREIVPLAGSDVAYDFATTNTAGGFFGSVRTNWVQLVNQSELVSAYSQYDNSKSIPDYLFPFSYSPVVTTNDIPVVLDQTDDGIYYGFDAEGHSTADSTYAIASNNIPDWVDYYYADDSFSERVSTNMYQMLDEAGIYAPYVDGQYDLNEISYLMSDVLAMHNTGKELCSPDPGYYKYLTSLYKTNWPAVASPGINHLSTMYPNILPSVYISDIYLEATTTSGTTNTYSGSLSFKVINPYNVPIDVSRVKPFVQMVTDTSNVYGSGKKFWGDSAWLVNGETNVSFSVAYEKRDEAMQLAGMALRSGTFAAHESADVTLEFDFYSENATKLMVRWIRLQGDRKKVNEKVFHYINPAAMDADGYNFLMMKSTDTDPMAAVKMMSAYDPRMLGAGTAGSRGYGTEGMLIDFPPDKYPYASAAILSVDDCPDGTYWFYYPYRETEDEHGVMDSLAFIGHCPLGQDAHFQTIPLVGTNAVDVAKYFAITNAWPETTGRININTPYAEVLAAGFNQLDYPSTNGVTDADSEYEDLEQSPALRLAEEIVLNRPDAGYTNVMHAFHSLELSSSFYDELGLDKFQLEEAVMRSRRLFTTRQQLFTIYVTAQSLNNGAVIGEATRVAVIWRDPEEVAGEHAVKLLAFMQVD
jgi:hypothetical protein